MREIDSSIKLLYNTSVSIYQPSVSFEKLLGFDDQSIKYKINIDVIYTEYTIRICSFKIVNNQNTLKFISFGSNKLRKAKTKQKKSLQE